MPCKYRIIADLLRSQITNKVYMENSVLPTEQDLCVTFHVSRQTVRQALNCLVDEGLIERRQGSGSRVLSQKPRHDSSNTTIAIITTYISDYIFPGILREAEAILSENGYTAMLYATSNQVSNERKILKTILNLLNEQKLAGIMVEGTKAALPNPNLDLYKELQAQNIPLVFFDSTYEELNAVSILDANYDGGYQLVEYLLNKGHQQIAGIFKIDDMQGHQRYAGYSAALRDHGLLIDDHNVFWYGTDDKNAMCVDSPLWITRIAPVLRNCSAVVCYNDEIASYLVQCLVQNQIALPDQMAVVSFDNSPYSELTAYKITSLSHGTNNLGRLAAEALMKLCNGQETTSQSIPWILVEKESS